MGSIALRIPGIGGAPADPDRSRAARWARGVRRRPKLAALGSVTLLLVMTAPLTGIRFGFPDAGNNPKTATSRVAYDLVSKGFGPGANDPLFVVAATPDAGARQRLAALRAELERVPGVKVVGRSQPSASGTTTMVPITPTTMVAVFGAFALDSEVFVKLIGVGLATAILIDATIVRMVLVPAVMELLGDRAWWTPRWLKRLVPEVHLEGAPAPRPPDAG